MINDLLNLEEKQQAKEFREKKKHDDPDNIFTKNLKILNAGLDKEHYDVLTDHNLFNNITEVEFDKKIVGELKSRKTIFLCAAGGRLVENSQIASFNLLVNDEAGTGKDYVVGAVLEILPSEIYIHKTRISPTVFTYWYSGEKYKNWTWDGKVFYHE